MIRGAAWARSLGIKKVALSTLLAISLANPSCSDRGDRPLAGTEAAATAADVSATALVITRAQVTVADGEGPGPVTVARTAMPDADVVAMGTGTPGTAVALSREFQPPDLGYLKAVLDARLASFEGLASYYVRDLKGGQAATRNGDVAISGTSMVKVPILVETYSAMDAPPMPAQTKLITETATLSGNYTANLLLELIAGQPDPFAGAQKVTTSMRQLGLYNTFIAVPYDLEPDPRYLSTYATPANQNPEFDTDPDSSMQTTVSDMGHLLTALYGCSVGKGSLLDVYADSLTEAECAEIIGVMEGNNIDAFIEEGVPDGVAVAHKHGWVGDTHGDAAIVAQIEHPYVLVIALHRPGWLEWADSTEIIADLSRLTYAHFSDPQAYTAEELRVAPPPLPMISPTPDLPMAIIQDTGGAGLVLRAAPGGAEVMILPEGSLVFLEGEAVEEGGRAWRHVRLLGDASGWVVADYLALP